MKTNQEIANDCGIPERSADLKTAVLDGWGYNTTPDLETVSEIIGALYRRIEKLEEECEISFQCAALRHKKLRELGYDGAPIMPEGYKPK